MLWGMRDDPPAPYAPRPPGALPCCCWRRDMLASPLGRLALPRPESSRAGRPAPGPAQSWTSPVVLEGDGPSSLEVKFVSTLRLVDSS